MTDYNPHVMASSQTNWGKTIVEQPTLRDQFAMAALTGMMATNSTNDVMAYVRDAYKMADAMLAAREEKK